MKIIGACVSDIGSIREENQDCIFQKVIRHGGQRIAVGAVFDGIGGLACGKDAAELLQEKLSAWVANMEKCRIASDAEVLFAHFKDEAETLNAALCKYMKNKQIISGSTMSALMIVGNRYLLIQVGDSRIYRFSHLLEQITKDEVCCRKEDGCYVNGLANYMGKKEELSFLEYQGKVSDRELFLFCSDGFYHHMKPSDVEEIWNAKWTEKKLKMKLGELIHTMIRRGEQDNLSAGVFVCKKSAGFLTPSR